jgi:Sec7-like guanine-nucleotide exchange factor
MTFEDYAKNVSKVNDGEDFSTEMVVSLRISVFSENCV